MAIRRIFLDSGMVLVHPRSGHWFHTTAYLEGCRKRGLPELTARQKSNEKAAYAHLAAHPRIRDEAEELELFLGYYSILFEGVEGKDDRDFIAMCATAKATDLDEQLVYDDVPASLERLARSYRLGVISDAWPSLEGTYRKNGLRGLFDPFVVSALHGHTKEGSRLFGIALSLVDEGAAECLFVDDSPDNCARARELGMEVLVLNRNRYQGMKGGLPSVPDMAGLERRLGTMAPPNAHP